MKKRCLSVVIALLIFLTTISSYAVKPFPKKANAPFNKAWKIEFNIPIEENIINGDNIYILDPEGNNHGYQVSLLDSSECNNIQVGPETNYNIGKQYTLHINKVEKSDDGKKIKAQTALEFEIASKSDEEIKFSDKNLEEVIRKEIDKLEGDIYKSDVKKIKILKADGRGISNLEGIENLINLEVLNLDRNRIVDISKLKHLTKLERLSLAENQISDISVLKHLINLELIWMSDNRINNISVLSDLPNVYKLFLSKNQISDISPLKNLTNLERLEIDNNQISNIEPMQDLKKLYKLCIWNNQISDIDALEHLTNLTSLFLSGNLVTDFSPTAGYYYNLIKKDFILPEDNRHYELVRFPDKNLEAAIREEINKPTGDIYKSDVEGILSLTAGRLDICDLEGMQNLSSLRYLYLSGNKISDISPIKNLTYISTLYLDGNKIREVNTLKYLFNIKILFLSGNPITDFSPVSTYYHNLTVKDFRLIANRTIKFPDENLEAIIREILDKPEGDIYKSDVETVEQLYAKRRGITNLEGIQNLTSLKALFLSGNSITDFSPVAGCYYNLEEKDFKLPGDIGPHEVIKFPDKNLEVAIREEINKPVGDIYKSDVARIQCLIASRVGICDLEGMQNLIGLQELYLDGNEINDISPLKNLSNLRHLSIAFNQVSDVKELENLKNLQGLILYRNTIRDLSPLRDLTNLEWLQLDYNQISDISPLKDLTNLQWLELDHNQISDINVLKDMINLYDLSLCSNKVSDISVLKNLKNLEILKLFKNKISDIRPLKDLTNLQCLKLSYNQILDISVLEKLTNLRFLYLAENEITDYSPTAEYYDNLEEKDFELQYE